MTGLARWSRLVALFLIVGIVLSPLRAVALTAPALMAYEARGRPTPTAMFGVHDDGRRGAERPRIIADDDARIAYYAAANPAVVGGAGADHAYDRHLKVLERRETDEGQIYEAPACTTAAEGFSAAEMSVVNEVRGIPLGQLSAATLLIPGLGEGVLSVELGEGALAEEGLEATAQGAAPAVEKSFFEGTQYTQKVLTQMQGGAGEFHSFPESVTAFESAGSVRTITGGDGVVRQMLEIPGSYGGRDGVFQFIQEADASINHRLFVPGGTGGP